MEERRVPDSLNTLDAASARVESYKCSKCGKGLTMEEVAAGHYKVCPEKDPERHCWVGAPEIFSLAHACLMVTEAFGEQCYLVGSATQHRHFRDVDVRLIMDDDKWKKLYGDHQNGEILPFWSLTCTAISEYLSKRSGLKVDFQVQMRGSVKQSDWDKYREPLAIYPIGKEPAWRKDSKA